jgi:hypothetical protein
MRGMLKRLAGSRRAQVAGLLAVAGLVAGFTFLGLWLSRGGTEPAQSEAVPPPPTAEDFWPDKQGVLHFCAVPGEEPDWPAGWCATELWFDPRNQRGRVESHDRDGTLESLAVVDGDTYGEYDGFDSSVVINKILGHQMWLVWLGAPGASVYHEAFLNRGIINATEATVDGVPALKIETAVLSEEGTVEANRTIYLDKASHLPIRTETKPVAEGEGTQKETHTTAYRVVEWLPVEAVDPALFALPKDLPEVEDTTIHREMTVEEARAFRDFDTYWLGESFQGLGISRVLEFRSTPGTGSIGPWTHYFEFDYSTPGMADRGPLQVSSYPVDMFHQPRASADFTAGPSDREVSVAGTTGVLSTSDSGVRLQLQLGNTVIYIDGDSQDRVLAAGQVLARLN